MSYCPEDGKRMTKASEQAGGEVTYQCPECKTLWHYLDGAYRAEMPEEPEEEDSNEPRCEVCDKEIPRGEDCYQVYLGHFTEGEAEFVTEDIVAYAHEGCLPLPATL